MYKKLDSIIVIYTVALEVCIASTSYLINEVYVPFKLIPRRGHPLCAQVHMHYENRAPQQLYYGQGAQFKFITNVFLSNMYI